MDHEEIPYPVKMYANRFKAEHERNSSKKFEELFRQSGVDAGKNAELAARIRRMTEDLSGLQSVLGRWRLLRWLLILIALAGLVGSVLYLLPLVWKEAASKLNIPHLWGIISLVGLIGSLVLIFYSVNRRIGKMKARVADKQSELDEKMLEAWSQMEPLNRLFQWDTIAGIVMKTLPIVLIDKYLSQQRMDQLCRYFHWTPDQEGTSSILCCQSGTLNGNPWILAEGLYQDWGIKTYHGSLEISWKEQVSHTDSNGRTQYRWETRHETLTASLEKPIPVYERRKKLIFGNEAAPELVFSRTPNELSTVSGGFFGRRKLKSAIAALEKKSRDLDNDFMIMANEEFDVCFNAVDRNNEQQFRLLFTPLAQQEMLTLLRDKTHGYGDDFSFRKDRMINIIASRHLNESDISGAPELFRNYDLAESRKVFLAYSNEFFRSFYFSLAPLLCIPLYQSHRNFEDIYQGVIESGPVSCYEYESFANAIGDKNFAPPGAVTPSILKTGVVQQDGPTVRLKVTASAFRGEDRVEYVSKFGGDGKMHDVPVHWTEYLPVAKESGMAVRETGAATCQEFDKLCKTAEWQKYFSRWKAVQETVRYRRSLAAFLLQSN
ncbi:MAG: hypothetical protein J5806_14910 [Lentisphaeria bacterium]|nr:hypothetical protein [Lentisphaeria bacterium]